ncbi:hypothetical protein L3073_11460 [Ancylomarina sp. DW003]|nr:hypothetical protein [Ancylomarina sp. DW003]MDE5422827.1 hypothetical protein [Ancylomarina sp. DW003]
MKHHLLIIGMSFLFMGCMTMSQSVVKPPPNVNVPEHALFISQSGTQTYTSQTVIDLTNNEMVILQFNEKTIFNVIRTGISLNPKNYSGNKIVTYDTPFEKIKELKKEEKKEKKEGE